MPERKARVKTARAEIMLRVIFDDLYFCENLLDRMMYVQMGGKMKAFFSYTVSYHDRSGI
jgi:hypothetical protein